MGGCGVDKDCQDLISGMLAYRPKDRLTIEDIIKHKWCAGKNAVVHSPSKLARVLKDRHKETRRRRRADKKKASEMQNSVKRKKRTTAYDEIKGNDPIAKGDGCPELPLAKFPQTFTTFYCKKDDLGAAYERALNVYSLAFDGKDCTQVGKDRWKITTTLQTHNIAYTIQTRIWKLEKSDTYAFEFKRIAGPSLDYRKIWEAMEGMLLALDEKGENPFWDTIECKDLAEEEEDDKKEKEKDQDDAKAEE